MHIKPQITLKEALELVSFTFDEEEGWQVEEVLGDVGQNVWGTINGRKWKFAEKPNASLKRLLEASTDEELIDAFMQLENN